MKFDIRILQESPTSLAVEEQNCSSLFELEELSLIGKLSGSINFSPSRVNEWYVSGQISGQQELTCVRTLEKFNKSFVVDLNVLLEIVNSQAEQGFDDTDEQIFVLKICPSSDSTVDFTECLRQLILLEQPLNPVKNPEKEFKWEEPKKATNEKHKIDPRWAKLKEVKIDNKD